MRLHFQKNPLDLFVDLGYTLITAAILLALDMGNIVAILLVLFAPGYVLVAALFPESTTAGKREIDWIERIALSFGLGIAVVSLLILLLNFTPFGIRFAPMVVTITAFTFGVGYAAYWRRMRLTPERRLSLTVDLALPEWRKYTAIDKSLTVALAVSIVVTVSTLAYVVLTPRPGVSFTEFYILGSEANSSAFPTKLKVSQAGSVIIVIVNHEAVTVNYNVGIDLVGVRKVYNATSKLNDTVEVNRTTLSVFNANLSHGNNWTHPYAFRISYTGLWKVQFLLFKGNAFSSAYRELHLYIRVT